MLARFWDSKECPYLSRVIDALAWPSSLETVSYTHLRLPEPRYLEQLKSVAASFGYTAEQIDQLLLEGWSTDEIEDALYCCDYL